MKLNLKWSKVQIDCARLYAAAVEMDMMLEALDYHRAYDQYTFNEVLSMEPEELEDEYRSTIEAMALKYEALLNSKDHDRNAYAIIPTKLFDGFHYDHRQHVFYAPSSLLDEEMGWIEAQVPGIKVVRYSPSGRSLLSNELGVAGVKERNETIGYSDPRIDGEDIDGED